MNAACWNCHQPPGALLFCEHCQSLQPPSENIFEFFGLPEKLQIDLKDLEKRFYDLSRRLHPDRFFRRPERERQLSLDATAALNDAYRTLKDPVARAEYVLARHGLRKSEQKSSNVPPELLEEVFELNTALEEMRTGDDSVRPQLLSAKTKFEGMMEEILHALEAAFADWDRTGSRAALEDIYRILNRRSYIRNLLRDVNAALN